jgi:hypothetical protein
VSAGAGWGGGKECDGGGYIRWDVGGAALQAEANMGGAFIKPTAPGRGGKPALSPVAVC